MASAGARRLAGLSEWEAFCLRHSKPGNLWLHFVSFLCFWGGPVLAWVKWNPWWLLPFFASGLIGVLGHALFKDGEVSTREATYQVTVPFLVTWMFLRILLGRYGGDLARARAKQAALSSPD